MLVATLSNRDNNHDQTAKIVFDLYFPYVDAAFHEKDHRFSGRVSNVCGYKPANQRHKVSHRIRSASGGRRGKQQSVDSPIFDSVTSTVVGEPGQQAAKDYIITCPSSSDSQDPSPKFRGGLTVDRNATGELLTVTEEEEESCNFNSSALNSQSLGADELEAIDAVISAVHRCAKAQEQSSRPGL